MIFKSTIQWAQVKWSKPTYHIKTKRALSRRESLKACLKRSGCLLKDLLQDGPSRISSPPTGHPTTYEKFVMNKYMKVENTQKIYLSVDFLVFKSIIS